MVRIQVNSKTEAKRLAFFLYCNILGRDNLKRPYIVPRDVEPFFDRPEEVRTCFRKVWRVNRLMMAEQAGCDITH